jgi:hypothetical protein
MRKNTWKKGKKLFEANHIFNVEEVRMEGKDITISAYCIRQTSVKNPDPYRIEITLGEERDVSDSICTCQAGINRGC